MKRFNNSLKTSDNNKKLISLAAILSAGVTFSVSYATDLALPQGPKVTLGSATTNISGNVLNVNSTTNQTYIQWNTFDIGKGYKVNFQQPNAASTVLNRVETGNASKIFGELTSNGKVILVNNAGIIFDKDAIINTQGLLATTIDANPGKLINEQKVVLANGFEVSDSSFKAGKNFTIVDGNKVEYFSGARQILRDGHSQFSKVKSTRVYADNELEPVTPPCINYADGSKECFDTDAEKEVEEAKIRKAEADAALARAKAEAEEAERARAEEAERARAEEAARAEAERVKAEEAKAAAERAKAEEAKAAAERAKAEKAKAEKAKAEAEAKARAKAEAEARAKAEEEARAKAKAEAEAKARAEEEAKAKAKAEEEARAKAEAEAKAKEDAKVKSEAEDAKVQNQSPSKDLENVEVRNKAPIDSKIDSSLYPKDEDEIPVLEDKLAKVTAKWKEAWGKLKELKKYDNEESRRTEIEEAYEFQQKLLDLRLDISKALKAKKQPLANKELETLGNQEEPVKEANKRNEKLASAVREAKEANRRLIEAQARLNEEQKPIKILQDDLILKVNKSVVLVKNTQESVVIKAGKKPVKVGTVDNQGVSNINQSFVELVSQVNAGKETVSSSSDLSYDSEGNVVLGTVPEVEAERLAAKQAQDKAKKLAKIRKAKAIAARKAKARMIAQQKAKAAEEAKLAKIAKQKEVAAKEAAQQNKGFDNSEKVSIAEEKAAAEAVTNSISSYTTVDTVVRPVNTQPVPTVIFKLRNKARKAREADGSKPVNETDTSSLEFDFSNNGRVFVTAYVPSDINVKPRYVADVNQEQVVVLN